MPAQSLIGNLAVNLIFETAAFEKGATVAEKRLNKLSREFERIGQGWVDLGKKLSLSVTAPIVAAGAAVVKMTGDFESAMNRVSISTQAGAGEMKAMSDLALQLGKDTTFGATDAADAMDMLAKNGLNAREILDGAATAAVNLASAAGSELSPAANAITDVMQQFKLTTADLPKAVNQITGAVNESKLDFVDFALAIGQAGGVAGASGVQFADFNAVLAGTSALFASGSDAGTSFKTFITRLPGQSKQAANAIAELGLQFYNADGSLRSMSEIAQELQDKLGGLSDKAKQQYLTKIFGTDAMRTAVGLMDLGAAGLDKIKGKIAETDAAAQAAQRLKGFNGQLEELKGSIETLAIRIGQSGLLELLTRLTTAAANLIDKWSEASPATLRFATVVAALAAAIGPLMIGFGMVVKTLAPLLAAFQMITSAGASFSGAAVALGASLGPLLPILAAIAAAGALIYLNWDKISPVLQDLWQHMQQALGPEVKALIAELSTSLSRLWSFIGPPIKLAIVALTAFFGAINRTFGPVVIDFIKGMINALAMLFKAFNSLGAIRQIVANLYSAIWEWLGKKLNALWEQGIRNIERVKKAFFGLYDAVVGHSYIPDMVDGIAAQMKRLDSVMVDPAKKATQKAGDAFKALAEDIRPLMDRLFPDAAALNAYRNDLATLDRGENGGAITAAQAEEARRRLGLQFSGTSSSIDSRMNEWNTPITGVTKLQTELMKLTGQTWKTAEKVEAANVRIVKSFKDMADDVLGSLQNLGNSIRSGGFLDIFSSVLDLLLQLGSIGAFGKKIQTNINSANFGGMRANGGPVVPGKSYIVGENGPEWFTPGNGGKITPMNDNGGVVVQVVPSPYFNVIVDQRAGNVAAPMAAASGLHATQAAQSGMQRRTRRTIPG